MIPHRRSTTTPRRRLPRPEASCGREICSSWFRSRKSWWPCGPILDQFDESIIVAIEDVLRNVTLGYADIYLRLYMLGRNKTKAVPIIMVCCSNARVREEAECAIRRSDILTRYPEFGLGASSLPLEQPSRATLLAGDMMETRAGPALLESSAAEIDDRQVSPSQIAMLLREKAIANGAAEATLLAADPCLRVGRRIFIAGDDGEPTRSATGGYILTIAGQYYQLIPGHIVEDVEKPPPFPTASDYVTANAECHFDGDSDDDDDDDDTDSLSDSDVAILRRGSATPSPPRRMSCEEPTSPALDDSPSSSTFSTGPRLSEKGLLRSTGKAGFPSRASLISGGAIHHHCVNGRRPHLDYAFLFYDFTSPIALNSNKIRTPGPNPRLINMRGPETIGNQERTVVAATDSGGGIRGRLFPGATYIHRADHPATQRLYLVQLEGVILEGACGAAVVDEETGVLYGHIVRGCPGTGVAYIVAATEVLADLRARLKQEIHLAGANSSDEVSWTTSTSAKVDNHDANANRHDLEAVSEHQWNLEDKEKARRDRMNPVISTFPRAWAKRAPSEIAPNAEPHSLDPATDDRKRKAVDDCPLPEALQFGPETETMLLKRLRTNELTGGRLETHRRTQHPAFNCIFAFAGCHAKFPAKNEWKRHINTQHLFTTYWCCRLGDCADYAESVVSSSGFQHSDAKKVDTNCAPRGLVFTRKDLYNRHIHDMHTPPEIIKLKSRRELMAVYSSSTADARQSGESSKSHLAAIDAELAQWEDRVRSLEAEAEYTRCELPTYMFCPVVGCDEEFEGANVWDERMEHVAKHLERAEWATCEECQQNVDGEEVRDDDEKEEPRVKTTILTGYEDHSLFNWATSPEIGIVVRKEGAPTGWALNNPLIISDAEPGEAEGEPSS